MGPCYHNLFWISRCRVLTSGVFSKSALSTYLSAFSEALASLPCLSHETDHPLIVTEIGTALEHLVRSMKRPTIRGWLCCKTCLLQLDPVRGTMNQMALIRLHMKLDMKNKIQHQVVLAVNTPAQILSYVSLLSAIQEFLGELIASLRLR